MHVGHKKTATSHPGFKGHSRPPPSPSDGAGLGKWHTCATVSSPNSACSRGKGLGLYLEALQCLDVLREKKNKQAYCKTIGPGVLGWGGVVGGSVAVYEERNKKKQKRSKT